MWLACVRVCVCVVGMCISVCLCVVGMGACVCVYVWLACVRVCVCVCVWLECVWLECVCVFGCESEIAYECLLRTVPVYPTAPS